MPFTFSHPAAVLWLVKKEKYLFVSALVVGTIVPDFEYFFRMSKGISLYSHSISGLFYFNLPVGYILFVIFHAVVKKPFIINTPFLLKRGWERLLMFSPNLSLPKSWIKATFSILIGSISHLIWDALVHESADYIYTWQHKILFRNPWIQHSDIYIANHIIHSLIGLVLILYFIRKMPVRHAFTYGNTHWKYWLLVALLTGVLFIIRYFLPTAFSINDALTSIIGAFLYSVIIVSLLFHKVNW